MRAVELFAGVGGFRLGLERNGHEVVWANEWDKYAAQTYDKNFGGTIDQRDITKIPTRDIPEHDLLVGGFPCQAFSIAGKRAGFDDTRGTMFFEVARILRDKKPQHLLLENVKGLLSHDTGRTFQTILGILADLGYRVEWQILNSKDFGVPQNRERVFIVGHLGACCGRKVFPLTRHGGWDGAEARGKGETSFCLTTRGGDRYDPTAQTYIANCLSTAQSAPSRTQRRSHENYIAIEQLGIRRLTPVECERLQGFPDNWTQGVSDTQRYKQMGNAVTVNVIEAVVRRMKHGA